MFVGHYSAAFAIRAADRTIPLWILFMAVQLVDVGWALLVVTGVEELRIVPGITATSPLDLVYVPYTHSLLAQAGWMALAFVLYRAYRGWHTPGAARTAGLVALAVVSHWLLDFIVHRPDLPLYDNAAKVGLGLWNRVVPAFALEIGLLGAGVWLFARRDRTGQDGTGRDRTGQGGTRWGVLVLLAVLVVSQTGMVWAWTPPTAAAMVSVALASYITFAVAAWWIERSDA